MNRALSRLHPYPFERLRKLFGQHAAPHGREPINLSIGEPKHPTPHLIQQALIANLGGLSNYPATLGTQTLREAIATWLTRRYNIARLDEARQILPVAGTREALFAIAQAVIERERQPAKVVCPNPFYQIYEGATLLAGADPIYANVDATANFAVNYASISPKEWAQVQLVYVCSPGNPTGAVMDLDGWRDLFDLSDRYGFVIVSDECYSEIYFGEQAPLGSLEAATALGRTDFPRLVCCTSLSKRSNAPGMRSGFMAGDASILEPFLLYRTYHGCALSPPIQAASTAAWSDEEHVRENRAKYRDKFERITPLVQSALETQLPDAAFYLWVKTPISDEEFAQRLYAEYNVAVLPGSYLARHAHGINPGTNYIRVALVAELDACLEGARRMVEFACSL